jgi:hypothetical protein
MYEVDALAAVPAASGRGMLAAEGVLWLSLCHQPGCAVQLVVLKLWPMACGANCIDCSSSSTSSSSLLRNHRQKLGSGWFTLQLRLLGQGLVVCAGAAAVAVPCR